LQKEILTKECIEKLAGRPGRQPGSKIIIDQGTIVTPLAEDYIRENNLKIEFGKAGQTENSDRAARFTENSDSAVRFTENSDRAARFTENSGTSSRPTKGTEGAGGFTTGPQKDARGFTKTGHLPDELSYETILQFYYLMIKIRFFEEFAKAYKQKDIIKGDFVHVYLGEEAIAAGVCSALKKEDFITSTHRGHGHMIAKGADVSKMFSELLGKSDGYSKGKGGSMHIADIGLGILGANGIVGAGLPIACGSALASKLNGDDSVTVAFFGDGASNQGTFGESLNFAKILSLPVIFFCENNGYAISTSSDYACSTPLIYKRGIGYDIPSVLIDGDDIFEVYFTCSSAIEEIRRNRHPVLIEAVTHRREGHWIGDPQNYRSAKDLADLPKYDPIKVFFDKISQRPDFSISDLERITLEVSEEIKKAVTFAENSPYLPPEESAKDYLKEQ
jgi:TPP-dependent pyruvate/acetoin dehydrogenase alpha subunit